jgi:hypothetical protein
MRRSTSIATRSSACSAPHFGTGRQIVGAWSPQEAAFARSSRLQEVRRPQACPVAIPLAAVRDAPMLHIESAACTKLAAGRESFLVRANPGFPTKEMRMTSNRMRCLLLAGAVIALGGLASFPVVAAAPDSPGADARPVVIAQATRPEAALAPQAIATNAFPAYERGVRAAAATSNEALRRYLWRTRMIYNFYYPDFASGE